MVAALRGHHAILVDREIVVHSTCRTLGTLHHSQQTHFSLLELAHLSAHFEYVTAKDHSPGLLALPRYVSSLDHPCSHSLFRSAGSRSYFWCLHHYGVKGHLRWIECSGPWMWMVCSQLLLDTVDAMCVPCRGQPTMFQRARARPLTALQRIPRRKARSVLCIL